MKVESLPIVIFSFNRPEFLQKLCQSLNNQKGFNLNERNVYLFQDGAVSSLTGTRYVEDSVIDLCKKIFNQNFPNATIMASDNNVGIALNIKRGEEFVFSHIGSPFGIFFEDDLELGPYYFQALEQMISFSEADERVGYIAAYGDHRLNSDPEQTRIITLEHNWGYVLRKSAWKTIMEWTAEYFAIIEQCDYRFRSDVQILRFYQRKSVASAQTSQDVVRTLACAANGIARIMTDTCFAHYIGSKGESFDQAKYDSMGYANTSFQLNERYNIKAPSDHEITEIIEKSRKKYSDYRQNEFQAFFSDFCERNFDPNRLASADDIKLLYKLLLDRVPEQGPLDEHVNKTPLVVYRSGFLKSVEVSAKQRR